MKTIKYLFLALMAMVGTMTFTACGDDDNESTTTNKSEFFFSFTLTDDVFEVADVKVAYIDPDGVEKMETVTSKNWSKTFSANKFDVSAGVLVLLNYKDEQTLSKSSYVLGSTCEYMATPYTNEKAGRGDSHITNLTKTVQADKDEISKRLEAIEEMLNYSFKIDANGTVAETTLEWSANSLL